MNLNMNNLVRSKHLVKLLVMLILVLSIYNTGSFIRRLYSNFVGRFLMICAIIYVTSQNYLLGLFSVIAIIAAINVTVLKDVNGYSLTEGFKDNDKDKEKESGIDLEDIKKAIAPKDSKHLPVNNMASSDVTAHSPELFKEGFSFAHVVGKN